MNTIAKAGGYSLAPSTMDEAMRFAKMLSESTMVPKEYHGKPANVLIAIQWGYEVGLGPLQAIQNIAVINGRPAIWGDAALALVRGHPACAAITEGVEGGGDARVGFCEVTRRGEVTQRRTFSVADAKKAGLWGKPGPWQNYPDRMLQLRARGFAIRDVFPDALRGVVTREEAEDTPEPRHAPNLDTLRAPIPAEPVVTAPTEPTLPILAPDGRLIEVREGIWLRSIEKALAGLESSEAVNAWRREMGPHFTAIQEAGNGLRVAEAMNMISDRLHTLYVLDGDDTLPSGLPSW